MPIDLDFDFLYPPAREAIELAAIVDQEARERCRACWSMLPDDLWVEVRRTVSRWDGWADVVGRVDYERADGQRGPANDNPQLTIPQSEFERAHRMADALEEVANPSEQLAVLFHVVDSSLNGAARRITERLKHLTHDELFLFSDRAAEHYPPTNGPCRFLHDIIGDEIDRRQTSGAEDTDGAA